MTASHDSADALSEEDSGDGAAASTVAPTTGVVTGDKEATDSRGAADAKDKTGDGKKAGGGTKTAVPMPGGNVKAADAGAAMAAAYFNAKPPAFAGPTGFRMWKAEVSVWQRLTSLAPEAREATTVASLTGVAKRLALTMPEDDLFTDTGVASLLTLLESRFGGTTGTTSMAAYSGMRACVRGGQTMDEYLVAFDESVAMCEEAHCPLDDMTKTNVVLHQANLSDMERTMAIATATKSPGIDVKYTDMTAALLTLYGGKEGGRAGPLVRQRQRL